uniref:Complex 1 LYR protein domain-containing protein n=1 Tax=Corethron hystrix TaxID=216773 RepID=A0A6U5DHJ5_9STRA
MNPSSVASAAGAAGGSLQRSSLQLYRDCLRLVNHVAPGSSPKAIALRNLVRSEFHKSKDVKDEIQVEQLKNNAIRALSNYMLYESGSKDSKLGTAMHKFNDDVRRDS